MALAAPVGCGDSSNNGSQSNTDYVPIPTTGARTGHSLVGEWMILGWVQDTCDARKAMNKEESSKISSQMEGCDFENPDSRCDSLITILDSIFVSYNSASTATWNVDMCKVGGIIFMDNAQCWGSFIGNGVWNVTEDSLSIHYLMLDGKTIDDSGHDEHLKYWFVGDTLRILRPAFGGDMAMDLSFTKDW